MLKFAMLIALAVMPVAGMATETVVLPVKFRDTSGQAAAGDPAGDAAHLARTAEMGQTIAQGMGATLLGADDVAAACQPQQPSCLLKLVGDKGADQGVFVVVRKPSPLILTADVSLVEAGTQTLLRHEQISFRGDTDETWRHAATLLLRRLKG